METLANAILELAAFLEMADDSTVNEDAAVNALETLASMLQSASILEKNALRKSAARLARKSKGPLRRFYQSFMSASGIDDAKAPRALKSPRPLKTVRSAEIRALSRELDAGRGDLEAVKRLIGANPDLVNARLDANENRPLNLAALYGYTDIVRLLIEAKADVNARNRHGSTPLHDVVMNNHQRIAALLIAAGGNLKTKDADGETPLSLAESRGRRAIAGLFRRHGARK